jgi:hypothetical protein
MFNPAKRCTAEEALDHEFLQPVRKKDLEVSIQSCADHVSAYSYVHLGTNPERIFFPQ